MIADVARRYGVAVHPECRVTVVPQGATTPLYQIVPGKGAVEMSRKEYRQKIGRILGRRKKFAALAARNDRGKA